MSSVRYVMSVMLTLTTVVANADDWLRFRGPGGGGVAVNAGAIPTEWSAAANLEWKTPLPGPGVSSPIVVDGRVFVTCYSGYGLSQEAPGDIENLMRHLLCVDLNTGKVLWQKDVKATLPEDPYSGVGVTAHGYASHTPVSDGESVYAFFGKSGVHAFDLDGNELWTADVGRESDPTKWGSSSSPVIHQDTVIVTASAESQAIVGLNKATGEEIWRQEAEGLDGMWGTPTLVKIDDDRTDLVMCVAKEMWGLDPSSGKLRWFADATGAEHAYSSVVVDGKRVFAFTGRGGGSIAIDAGGKGDVSDTKTVWAGNETASFGSPVRHDSKLYVVSRGVLTVVDQVTGEKIDQVRLSGARSTGGRFGSLDYPSPIVVGDRLFYLNGSGQTFVFDLAGALRQTVVNQLTSEKESFGGSPAVSDGRLLIRSSKHLYCVADKGQQVTPDANAVARAKPPETAPRQGNRGGNRSFDPMSMFNDRDSNKDGKLTADEIEGGPLADRLMELDKNSDEAVDGEEFRTGIASLFRSSRGGGGGGRGGGYRGGDKDSRPDRPQRPEIAP